MRRLWKIRIWLIVTGLYLAALLHSSLITDFVPEVEFFVNDWVHIPAYAALAFLVYKTCRYLGVRGIKTALALSVFFSLSYGGLIEIMQGYSGREPSWLDQGFNTLGALIMATVIIQVKGYLLRAGVRDS